MQLSAPERRGECNYSNPDVNQLTLLPEWYFKSRLVRNETVPGGSPNAWFGLANTQPPLDRIPPPPTLDIIQIREIHANQGRG